MYMITISFGPAATQWSLLFKTLEGFNSAMVDYKNPATFNTMDLEITDDFGQHLCVKRSEIRGALFEDLAQSKLGFVERSLHQTRMQVDANNAVRADPGLMAHFAQQQQQQTAPRVLTPFGNGGFRQ